MPRSVLNPLESNQANVDGTVNVLVAARDAKVKRVIYAASSSAYGDTPTLPKREDMSPNPISPYAVAKLGERVLHGVVFSLLRIGDGGVAVFQYFWTPAGSDSPYSGVLAKFITQMLKGEQPTIHGDGTQSRDFTYVDNVVHANLLACKAPASEVAGRVFNVATGTRIDLNEMFRVLKKLTGFPGEVKHGPERAGDVRHSLADLSRSEKHLGYKPKVNFEEGLRRTIDWYRTQEKSATA